MVLVNKDRPSINQPPAPPDPPNRGGNGGGGNPEGADPEDLAKALRIAVELADIYGVAFAGANLRLGRKASEPGYSGIPRQLASHEIALRVVQDYLDAEECCPDCPDCAHGGNGGNGNGVVVDLEECGYGCAGCTCGLCDDPKSAENREKLDAALGGAEDDDPYMMPPNAGDPVC